MTSIFSVSPQYTGLSRPTRSDTRHAHAYFGAEKSKKKETAPLTRHSSIEIKRAEYINLRNTAYDKAKEILNEGGIWKGLVNRVKAWSLYHVDETTGKKVWGKNYKFAGKKWLQGFKTSDNWWTATKYVIGPLVESALWDTLMVSTGVGIVWPLAKILAPGIEIPGVKTSLFAWSNAYRDFFTNMQIAQAMHMNSDFANSKDISFLTVHGKTLPTKDAS